MADKKTNRRTILISIGDIVSGRTNTRIKSECPKKLTDDDCRAYKLLAAVAFPDDIYKDYGSSDSNKVSKAFFYDMVPFGSGKGDEIESLRKALALTTSAEEACRFCQYLGSQDFKDYLRYNKKYLKSEKYHTLLRLSKQHS